VADLVNHSVVDGPGNRFVAFLQGCTFDCIACHNPQTIPFRSPLARWMTAGELVDAVREVEPFISGITISGGEPTLQPIFVRTVFDLLRSDPELRRLTTFVDSNGDAPRDVWDALIPVMDGAMIDLKALDPELHVRLTGVVNNAVLASIRHLAAAERLHEVRLLLVPGINDAADALQRTAAWLLGVDPAIRVKAIGFRRHGVRRHGAEWREAADDDLARYREVLEAAGVGSVVTV
jgi:pyruvate-formate lyase-activating enzyme